MNLLVNAAQAIPEGRANANRIRVATRLHDGQVTVEIEDTGCGIPAATMQRLFTPFSSRPSPLESARASQVGQGTTVRVKLPAAPGDAVAQASSRPAFVPPARRGRVLVMDDEFSVGVAVRRILPADHEVVALTSARQALERILAGDSFDVILCDVMMPVMTGAEFNAELRARAGTRRAHRLFDGRRLHAQGPRVSGRGKKSEARKAVRRADLERRGERPLR